MNTRIERLYKWYQGEKAYPTKIEFFPTNKCNSLCVFCHRRVMENIDTSSELPLETCLNLVKESAEMGVLEWHLIGGGEPMADPEKAMAIMRAIKSYGMYGYLNTNGTCFSSDIISELVKIEWDYIKFSLHGPDNTTHDRLTGIEGSFDKVYAALKEFQKEKDKQSKKAPRIEIGPVLCKANFNKLLDMVKLASELGVEEFRPQAMTIYSAMGKALKLSEQEEDMLQSEVEKIYRFCQKKGISTNIMDFAKFDLVKHSENMENILLEEKSEPDSPFLNLPCFEPWYHMTIHSDGRVGVCGFTTVNYSDYLDRKILKDIWFGEKFEQIRKSLLSRQLPDYCSHCVSVVVMVNKEIKDALKNLVNSRRASKAPGKMNISYENFWKKISKKFLKKFF